MTPLALGCNCQGGLNSCPVDGACQTKDVVDQATVLREDNGTKETYTGLTSRLFKDRYYKHRQDFNSEAREGTSLSNHVCKSKNQKTKILSKCKSFNPATKKCDLCLRVKFCIIFKPEGASLNNRSELFSTCRHSYYWTRLRFFFGHVEPLTTPISKSIVTEEYDNSI